MIINMIDIYVTFNHYLDLQLDKIHMWHKLGLILVIRNFARKIEAFHAIVNVSFKVVKQIGRNGASM